MKLDLPASDTPLSSDDMRRWTNAMIDTQLALIADATDADVVFEPVDPEANDTYAASAVEVNLPWSLGHLIVHVTASSEESAFLAAELARGFTFHGRSRSEVPWETVTSVAQCRHRLEESRLMRLSSLDIWPDDPDLENSYSSREGAPPINAVRRFMSGLRHDNSHVEQIAEVMRQAKAARIPA